MRERGWLGHDAAAIATLHAEGALCRQRIHSRKPELGSLAWVFAKEEESARGRSRTPIVAAIRRLCPGARRPG